MFCFPSPNFPHSNDYQRQPIVVISPSATSMLHCVRRRFGSSSRALCPSVATTRARKATVCMVQADVSYKRAAAVLLVDRFIRSGSTVGLGSGELVNHAIAEIGQRLANGSLESVTAVPSCNAAASEAAFNGVPMTTLEKAARVDVAFEEVDQLDLANNAAVKGVLAAPQQPQLLAVHQLASKATQYVLMADASQVVSRLNGSLPVVIEGGDEWEVPAEELDDVFLGDAELWRRPAEGTANPRGGDNPYVSPEGYNIIDVKFTEGFKLFGEDAPYAEIISEITKIEGVVTHGLLLRKASAVILAKQDSEPEVKELRQ